MKPAVFYAYSDANLIEAIHDTMAEARRRGITHAADCAAFGIPAQEAEEIEEAAVKQEIENIQRRQAQRIIEQAQKRARKEAEENEKREKQIKNWTKKRDLALLIQGVLGEEWGINVWDGSDKRVYIDGLGRKKVTYYCEGNRYNPPGKLELEKIKLTKEQKNALLKACRKADEDWLATRFSIDEAAAWQAPRPLGTDEHDIDIDIERG